MIRLYSGAALLASTCALFSGCQSIPARPLDLNANLEALRTLEIAPEPVLNYARGLAESRTGTDTPLDPSDGLTLHEAEAVALWYNPEARISRLEVDRAAAMADVAGRWDDPALEVSSGRKREESDAPGGVERSWIGAASLSITVPLSGRQSAERRARSAEHAAALHAAAEQEWRVLMELRNAWLIWSASLERLRLLDEHLGLVGQFDVVARSLAEAGELDPGSARMFSIERAEKQALRDSTVWRGGAYRADVLRIMGLLPDATVELAPQIHVAEDVGHDEIDTTAAALRHRSVTRLAAEYEAAEARLRVELRKQYPDLTIAPGYSDEGGESSITLGLGLLPIPVWNANRPGITEAASQRDIAHARATAALQQVIADIARAESRLAGARALREGLAMGAAPEADLQMTEAGALLRAGEADMGMVFQALTQAYAIKLEMLDATLEEQQALAELHAMRMPAIAPAEVEVER